MASGLISAPSNRQLPRAGRTAVKRASSLPDCQSPISRSHALDWETGRFIARGAVLINSRLVALALGWWAGDARVSQDSVVWLGRLFPAPRRDMAKASFPTLLPQLCLPAEGSDWKLHFRSATEVKSELY